MEGSVAKQLARWSALGALFLIPLTPLIVANSFFFPFITGKAFYLRILVEVAVAGWIVLALLDKAYRPRLSWVGIAAIAFVAWMCIADALAPNAAKAFWSNFERMEGWVLLIHLLGFFFAASAVLRVERKWRAWFFTSLGVAVVLSGYALLQLGGSLDIHQGSTRIDATLGNSAYFAVYLLFSVFVALWLALTEKQVWLKWALIALAVVDAILIFFTETRGTIIGLVLALSLAALLTVGTAGKSARRWAAGGLLFIVLCAGSFYLARDSAFVQENHILRRIATISLHDGATRFAIWNIAWQGAMERPLVGWGQEGFNYVFNKYYDPSLYRQEPWFDRAHNAFIDWLSAGGIPAFLLYIGLFISALYLLWRHSELSRPERIALTAALVGYAVHNMFVFDNIYSYVYFFAVLALIDSQVARPVARLERMRELTMNEGATYALPIAGAAVLAIIWFVNVPGMQVASRLISILSSGDVKQNIVAFERLSARPSFAAQEVREQLISYAGAVAGNASVPTEDKERLAALAVREMRKQVERYPNDARERLQLSYAYRLSGDGGRAFEEVRNAITLSPNKVGFWIEAGAIAWDIGNIPLAQAAFHKAYELAPQFPELAAYAAAGDLAVGDTAGADALLRSAFGTTNVDSDILAIAYYRVQAWQRLINLWKLRVEKPDATAETWFSLAAAYYAAGRSAEAVATVREAVARYPSAAASGEQAIRQIESGN